MNVNRIWLCGSKLFLKMISLVHPNENKIDSIHNQIFIQMELKCVHAIFKTHFVSIVRAQLCAQFTLCVLSKWNDKNNTNTDSIPRSSTQIEIEFHWFSYKNYCWRTVWSINLVRKHWAPHINYSASNKLHWHRLCCVTARATASAREKKCLVNEWNHLNGNHLIYTMTYASNVIEK